MNSNASDGSYIDGYELVNNVSTGYGGGIYMFQKKAFEIKIVIDNGEQDE